MNDPERLFNKKISVLVFVGKESTLFVFLVQNSLRLDRTGGAVLQQMLISIKRRLSEKLALIPETKDTFQGKLLKCICLDKEC